MVKKHRTLLIIIIVAIVAFSAIIGVLAWQNNRSTGVIIGTVKLGPTCPVERDPPDPQCADKPYDTRLALTTSDGSKVIREFSTFNGGGFTLSEYPGIYAIRSAKANSLPSCSSTHPIMVVANQTTDVEVSCDTGIR